MIPPALLERKITLPFSARMQLHTEPVISFTAKPAPTSTPLTAPMPSIPPSAASSLQKTGSPSPAGTPSATSSTTPPEESPAADTRVAASSIPAAASGSGQFTTWCTPYRSRTSPGASRGAPARILSISFSISAKTRAFSRKRISIVTRPRAYTARWNGSVSRRIRLYASTEANAFSWSMSPQRTPAISRT